MSWDAALAAADRFVAKFYDTTACTAVPMSKPERAVNAVDEPDTARLSFDFLCTVDSAPAMVPVAGHGGRGVSQDDIAARQVSRTMITALMTDWPWMPRKDDRFLVVAPDGCETLYLAAANAERDGTDRVVFWVNRIAG